MIYHVEKMGNQMRGKSRHDGRGMNKGRAKKTTCNSVRPPWRLGAAKAGWAERGSSESTICQTKEFKHYPQANGRHA